MGESVDLDGVCDHLRAMELFVKEEKEPQFIPSEDTAAVNLEHILPIKPAGDWQIETDTAEAYFKRLENMVLLGARDNVKIGNQSFADKKKVFKDSPFILTAEVAANAQWGATEIRTRQASLAEMAPKVWPLKWK